MYPRNPAWSLTQAGRPNRSYATVTASATPAPFWAVVTTGRVVVTVSGRAVPAYQV